MYSTGLISIWTNDMIQQILKKSIFLNLLHGFSKQQRKPGGTASLFITNISYHTIQKGYSFNRTNYKIVKQAIKGFKHIRPPKKRTKKPLNIIILRKIWPFIDKSSYIGKLIAAALCLAYWYGLRVSKYAATAKDIRTGKRQHLRHEHVHFTYKNRKVIEATITTPKSKCIQAGEKPKKVSCRCTCPDIRGPHTLHRLMKRQKKTLSKLRFLLRHPPAYTLRLPK